MGGLGDHENEIHNISFSLSIPKEKAKVQSQKKKEEAKAKVPVPSHCALQRPFVHPTRFTLITDADQRSVPVFRVNVTDSHCLVIMLEIRHPNILRAESIICGAGKTHTLLVQPYVGNLVEYFEDMLLNRIVDLLDIILSVQNVFRQIIDGIIYLIEHDLYHGDLKLENTYFCMDNHKPVIKLANFIEWTAPPAFDSEKLKSEWFHIGNALDQVVELITKYKPEADLRCL